MKLTIPQVLEGIGSLASLPEAYQEIVRVLNDPQSSIENFAEVIGRDPNITARILKLANSAFYGWGDQVETITKAIQILGTQQIRDLVTATLVLDYFHGVSPDLIDMKSFWRHSVGTAIAAKTLANFLPRRNPERAFVAGLLHDVGRLVIYLRLPEETNAIFAAYGKTAKLLSDAETEVLGFDHAKLGGELLKAWNFPPKIVMAVEFHHHPLTGLENPLESAVVHIADTISHAMQLGSSGELYPPPFKAKAWERLGLSAEVFLPTFDEVDRQFDHIVRILVP
jgi:putative nucleotidyltransferase with HDIG domain